MEEIWKDIIGYEGMYQVSSFGRVKSFKCGKERILKESIDAYGYYKIALCKDGKPITKKIHKLVAIAFLNHKPNGYILVVNHININKLDNNVNNLEIVTARDNTNKKHLKSTSEYTGVGWHKRSNKWTSRILINKKQFSLGYFKTEIEASIAYQTRLKEINQKNG